MIRPILKCKRSQAQVITTVLLILISIAAIAIVSTVIINFVRNRLVFTECFDTLGQVSIDIDSGYTYYLPGEGNASSVVVLSIKRGPSKEFNLTGLLVSLQSPSGAEPFELIAGEATDDVVMYSGGSTISIPKAGGRKTYNFTVTDEITGVAIAPILEKGQCDTVDETLIPLKE